MSIHQISTKVCIIGASPAGLLIANILQKHRIASVVIEERSPKEPYTGLGTDSIDYQGLTILKEYGLSDRLIKEGIPQSQCEFRTLDKSFVLDYGAKSQGQTHYAFPQAELLRDLAKKYRQAGGEILFNAEEIEIINSDRFAMVKCKQNGRRVNLECDFIAGCDGFDGVSRQAIPLTIAQPHNKDFDYTWLAITVAAKPAAKHAVYSMHPNGFAGCMLRDRTTSNYYLQVSPGDTVEDWSDSRIWSELNLRLAQEDEQLDKGEIVTKEISNMRHSTLQKMQYCRLFLAGSSAHVLTPAGGKGINLALQDGHALGKSLVGYYLYHDNLPLKHYSKNRLPIIRQTQQFCESFLHTINTLDSSTLVGKSQERVQRFKRLQLMSTGTYALDFSRKYVGYVESDRSIRKLPQPKKSADVLEFNPAQLPPLKVG
ncbi:MAG: FAD-dependent monooxygenase [Cyanobacteria bacterium P01_G01_bin.19]